MHNRDHLAADLVTVYVVQVLDMEIDKKGEEIVGEELAKLEQKLS